MKPKTLFLIRHAKAEEFSFFQKDYDRNLMNKGITRAKHIASKLKDVIRTEEEILVISSSANRAIQTAHIFCDILNYPQNHIIQTQNIYEAHYLDILNEINKVPDHIDTLFVFGHNPGLSNLTNELCNSYIELKTSEAAQIELLENFTFAELSAGTAQLKKVFTE